MPHVRIRRMKQTDLNAVSDLAVRCYPKAYYEDTESFVSKFKAFPKGCFVLEARGKLVAYAITFPYHLGQPFPLSTKLGKIQKPSCHYFHDVCVMPGNRKLGYATMLIATAWDSCALPKSLTAVRKSETFWIKIGFKEIRKIEYGGVASTYMEWA